MRIGIVGSGYEMLPLVRILQQYDHAYDLFLDWQHWPWGEKSPRLREERVFAGIRYLIQEVGVEKVIVPPSLERNILPADLQKFVLPLFSTYVLEQVLPYSVVGKIGLLGEEADMPTAETVRKNIAIDYSLSPTQEATRKFHPAFPCWKKNVRMWTYFLTTFGARNRMMRKTIKYDLAYFLDAGVDTLVPLSRGCLFYETIIGQRTNRKKIRFHGKTAVAAAFTNLVSEEAVTSYSMTLHTTDTPSVLFAEKKWMDVLTRGGKVELVVKEVTI